MKLFTKEFLDKLQKRYRSKKHEYMLNSLMKVRKLSFHDAIVLMAKWEKMKPQYIGEKDEEL